MPDDEQPTLDEQDLSEDIPRLLDLGDLTTQTIYLDSLFTKDVTQSGSFDVKAVRLTSFARLLNAMPVPVLLVDRSYGVSFANECWKKVNPNYRKVISGSFGDLFSDSVAGKKAHTLIESVFADRKAQMAQGLLQIGDREIWARMHFRSLRIGTERYVLVPVEDLTLEREKAVLQETHRLRLQEAHDGLELRVKERTAELEKKNEQLRLEINEREQAEHALRASEERFRAVFESAEDWVFIKDRSLRYSHVNPALLNALRVPLEEVLGRTDKNLVGSFEARISSEVERRVLSGQTVEMEQTVKFAGPAVTCNFIRVPLRDGLGRINGLCGIGRDITQRRKRENQLQSGVPADLHDSYTSAAMQNALEEVRRAAATDSMCLFLGETGAGKDYLARYLHDRSPRSGGPFFSINCAAVARDLAESELFGHESGAFTGAIGRKRGLLELAEGGTLLLNEIGELSLVLQAKLLNFLDTQTFTRVGGEKQITVNARLVAATNRDLAAAAAAGTFRQDLFYRLNVVTISVPPLRERIKDIPVLVEGLLESIAKRIGIRGVPDCETEVVGMLERSDWPGNVRELRNVLERALILSEGKRITVREIGLKPLTGRIDPTDSGDSLTVNLSEEGSMAETLKSVKIWMLTEALSRRDGRITEAADLLGISRDSFNHHMKNLGIRRQ